MINFLPQTGSPRVTFGAADAGAHANGIGTASDTEAMEPNRFARLLGEAGDRQAAEPAAEPAAKAASAGPADAAQAGKAARAAAARAARWGQGRQDQSAPHTDQAAGMDAATPAGSRATLVTAKAAAAALARAQSEAAAQGRATDPPQADPGVSLPGRPELEAALAAVQAQAEDPRLQATAASDIGTAVPAPEALANGSLNSADAAAAASGALLPALSATPAPGPAAGDKPSTAPRTTSALGAAATLPTAARPGPQAEARIQARAPAAETGDPAAPRSPTAGRAAARQAEDEAAKAVPAPATGAADPASADAALPTVRSELRASRGPNADGMATRPAAEGRAAVEGASAPAAPAPAAPQTPATTTTVPARGEALHAAATGAAPRAREPAPSAASANSTSQAQPAAAAPAPVTPQPPSQAIPPRAEASRPDQERRAEAPQALAAAPRWAEMLPANAVAGAAAALPSAPAEAQAALAAHPQSAAFAPELGAQLTHFVRNGVEHARLSLNPAELGPVTVQIQLEGSHAQIHLSAEQAPTRQALEQAMPQLASQLREAGLTLSGGGVFEQPRQGREAPGSEGGSAGSPSRNGRDSDAATLAAMPAAALPARRRGVVDLVA
ncbi:hypothetical protein RA210_U40020 [Rubrivivax sp. A210]|uniref:flagellar hook-length control protein FliK n=1 Tax=Rubrivivax sp. A210 TaxID=2772301 RepID=UPI001919D0A4|nr:flagellar hook-length control protein FliK [Rubrivivax sp. A210]CAD5373617.1 hypothetical protein RA210_U40020 [Rubrivivax sp. A210]